MLRPTMLKSLIQDLANAGWTQEEIADRVGVGQAAISKIVTDKRKDMRFQHAKNLIALHAKVCSDKAAA